MRLLPSPWTARAMSMWPVAYHGGRFIPGIGPGSADSTIGGIGDGFVAKLDANLSSGLELINDKVNFVVQSTSLSSTPVSGGPAGVYTITARLTNKSQQNILEPIQGRRKDVDQREQASQRH